MKAKCIDNKGVGGKNLHIQEVYDIFEKDENFIRIKGGEVDYPRWYLKTRFEIFESKAITIETLTIEIERLNFVLNEARKELRLDPTKRTCYNVAHDIDVALVVLQKKPQVL